MISKENFMDCIFCKIINGEIPCEKVLETDNILAFKDINPAADEHILIIPKKHIADIDSFNNNDSIYAAEMIIAARDIAQKLNLNEKGYRLIINNGKAAGQDVFHLHLHILGGMDSLGPMIKKS